MRSQVSVMRLWLAVGVVGALITIALPISAELSDKVRDRIRERSRSQAVRPEVKAQSPQQPGTVGGLLGSPRSGVALPRSTPAVVGAPRSPSIGGVLGGRVGAPTVSLPSQPPISRGTTTQPSVVLIQPPTSAPRTSVGGVLGGRRTEASPGQVVERAPRSEVGTGSPSVGGIGRILGSPRARREETGRTEPVGIGTPRPARSPGEVLGGSRPQVPIMPRSTVPRGSGSVSVDSRRTGDGIDRSPTVGSLLGESRATRRIVTYGPGRRTARSGRVVVIPPPTYKHVSVYLGFGALLPSYHLRLPGVSVSYFYYPYYWAEPFYPGYTVFPSLYYYYYPFVPRYIYGPRVIVLDRPTYIIERRDEVYVKDDVDYYYLSPGLRTSLKETLEDIRDAWVHGEFDLLLRHVRSEGKIHVNLRGKYVYSLTPEDYRDMTKDAVENTDTKSFEWVRTEKVSDDEVIAKARHEFADKDGERRTVYASYRLKEDHGVWWIVGVGSSNRLSDD